MRECVYKPILKNVLMVHLSTIYKTPMMDPRCRAHFRDREESNRYNTGNQCADRGV